MRISIATWTATVGLIAAAVLALPGRPTAALTAEPGIAERFEGPETSWRPAGGDAQFQILQHARTEQQPHSGRRSEKLHLSAGNGSRLLFRHATEPATVISELAASVWVRSDKAGIRLAARVVLPRTEDPRTGKPLAAIVWGTEYEQPGPWRQLKLDGVANKLTQQVRVLRQEVGPHVDSGEAYIDQLLLNVYGGRGETTVWIDDLEMTGVALRAAVASGNGFRRNGPQQLIGGPANAISGRRRPVHDVRFEGQTLVVDDRPFLPRIVEYQGEPLSAIRDLGFNAIRLVEPPTEAMLAEARQHKLWFVCPPPSLEELTRGSPTPELDRVLVWDLGRRLSQRDLEATRAWSRAIRRNADLARRPQLVGAIEALDDYSRVADVLTIGRDVLFTTLELADYGRWLDEQRRLARAGTPIWAEIQTQADARVEQQWHALSGGGQTDAGVDYRQLQQLLSLSLRNGAHGLFFTSHSSLTAANKATQQRAKALEQINLLLNLIEPWAAAGGSITAANATARVQATVVQIERARLLIPVAWGKGGQFVPPPRGLEPMAFVLPGVPETNEAYALAQYGLRPIRRRRVSGGIRVTLEDPGVDNMVVLTQDAAVVGQLSQHAARGARRAAQLQRDLTIHQLETLADVDQRLAPRLGALAQTSQLLGSARSDIARCDASLAKNDWRSAFQHSGRALSAVSHARHLRWQQYAQRGQSPVATPLGVHFDTLPAHFALLDRVSGGQVGPELLAAGGFENLAELQTAGWQHFQHDIPNVSSAVALAPSTSPARGSALRLRATASDAEQSPRLVATSPVWVSTPVIAVPPGALLRITGYVRVDKPITGSVDGLLVFDSITGQSLAQRIGQTNDWRPFTVVRAASPTGEIQLTFALSGLGEALIDGISIRVIAGTTSGGNSQTAATPRSPTDGVETRAATR